MTPEGWQSCCVLDVCDKVSRVATVPRSEYRAFGAIPIVDQGQAPIAGYTDNSELAMLELPIIVFGDHTRIWKYVDFPFAPGADGTQLLKPKTGHEPRYVFQALSSLSLKNLGYSRHFKLLRESSIWLPPLWEQKKIAAILTAVDEAIEATQAVIDQLQVVKSALMSELLTRGLPGRHTVFADSEVGQIPAAWRITSLGNCCFGEARYGANASKAPFVEGGSRYLRITDIDDHGGLNEERVGLDEHIAGQYELFEGDCLFARSGATVGKFYRYRSAHGKCAFAGYLIRFRPDPAVLLPAFLEVVAMSPRYKEWVASSQRAQAQPNINAKEYAGFLLGLPTIDEQAQIAVIHEQLSIRIRKETETMRSALAVKHALAENLLTGRVRVKSEFSNA